jgi:predicted metalloprotease
LIGLKLLRRELQQFEKGGIAVAGIAAHECGHIYQYHFGLRQLLSAPTRIYLELHADYAAGFYLGRRGLHSFDNIFVFVRTLLSNADYNYNRRSDHGTPMQRAWAMELGYEAGKTDIDVQTAMFAGVSLVRKVPRAEDVQSCLLHRLPNQYRLPID